MRSNRLSGKVSYLYSIIADKLHKIGQNAGQILLCGSADRSFKRINRLAGFVPTTSYLRDINSSYPQVRIDFSLKHSSYFERSN